MVGFSDGQPQKSPTLLVQMQAVSRLRHYAIHMERAYCEWVRRYAKFDKMKSRAELTEVA